MGLDDQGAIAISNGTRQNSIDLCTIFVRSSVVNQTLSDVEIRVLGSLVEKEITTPDYYPLSLNSLVAACNQSSNRNPVVHYDESTVAEALDTLREKKLVHTVDESGSRVIKYRHVLYEAMNL